MIESESKDAAGVASGKFGRPKAPGASRPRAVPASWDERQRQLASMGPTGRMRNPAAAEAGGFEGGMQGCGGTSAKAGARKLTRYGLAAAVHRCRRAGRGNWRILGGNLGGSS